MTRLTQLPSHLDAAIDSVVDIKMALIIAKLDIRPSKIIICAIYTELRNEIRKDFICFANVLLESGKARIVTGGKGRQGENDLIINLGVEKPHDKHDT